MDFPQKKTQLVRGLSLTAAMVIVAGSMIGSGIFRKPATMAGQLMSPELLIVVWIVVGLITFIGVEWHKNNLCSLINCHTTSFIKLDLITYLN